MLQINTFETKRINIILEIDLLCLVLSVFRNYMYCLAYWSWQTSVCASGVSCPCGLTVAKNFPTILKVCKSRCRLYWVEWTYTYTCKRTICGTKQKHQIAQIYNMVKSNGLWLNILFNYQRRHLLKIVWPLQNE